MSRLRWLLVASVALSAVYAAACAGGPEETDLNPQPLPPSAPGQDDNETDKNGGASSGTGSSGGGASVFDDSGTSPPSQDAGDGGDAGARDQ